MTMTMTESAVDPENDRLRLTFGEEVDIDDLIRMLQPLGPLCRRAAWLAAYAAGTAHLTAGLDGRRISSLLDQFRLHPDPPTREWMVSEVPSLMSMDGLPRGYVMWDKVSAAAPEWAQPRIERISKQSPLWMELAIDALQVTTLGAAATTIAVKVLKHPYEIGAWLPRFGLGWRETRVQALQAKVQEQRLQREIAEMTEAEDPTDSALRIVAGMLREEEFDKRQAQMQNAAARVRTPYDPHDPLIIDETLGQELEAIQNDALGLRRSGLTAVQGESLPEIEPRGPEG